MSTSGDNVALRKSLLEAIFFVRCQRQRPTFERIYHHVHRQPQFQNSSFKKIEAELEAAVRHKVLVATEKDGIKGYKEAFPVPRDKASTGVKAGSDLSEFTRTVMQAILKLMEAKQLATHDSICNELLREFAMKGSRSDLYRRIEESCNRAITFGQMRRYCSGYVVTHYGRTFVKKSSKKVSHKASQKKLPLDEILEAKEVATPIPICSLCLGTAEINREGVAEFMLACVDCGRCGHPSCLKFTPQLTETVKSTKWQCIECKMCSLCAKAGREQNMLFCDSCDRGFHMDCCVPPILRRPKGNWDCCLCNLSTETDAPSYHRRKRVSCDKDVPVEQNDDDDGVDGDAFDPDGLPPGVSEEDEVLFKSALERLSDEQKDLSVTQVARFPSRIEIGKFNVVTWYSSPYPQNYARLSTLYICEHCLTYVDSRDVLDSHMRKCELQRPPGNEIYRQNNLSVFEVDGNVARNYCQNLCLLAKLFLDHKTLYYDVEPFVFYVLTENDERGSHLIGYFSKEKYCQQKYNLSCIMTLPQYQRQGYGRLLIDFSYMLSRVEGVAGSPEKPLSDLGQISYESYWKDTLMNHLVKLRDKSTTIQGLCEITGIAIPDILLTLQSLGLFFQSDNKSFSIVLDQLVLDKWKARCEARGRSTIKLEESLLQWCPTALTSLIEFEEKQAEIELEQISMVTNSIIDARRKTPKGNKQPYSRKGQIKVESPSPVSSLPSSPVHSRADIAYQKYSSENNVRLNGLHSNFPPLNSSTPHHNHQAPQRSSHFKRRQPAAAVSSRGPAKRKQGTRTAFGGKRLLEQRNLVNDTNSFQTKTKRFLAAMESHCKSTRVNCLSRRHSSAASDRNTISPRSQIRSARLSATLNISSSGVVSQLKVDKKLPRHHPCVQSRRKRTVYESLSSSEAVENKQQCSEEKLKKKRGWVKGRPRNPDKYLLYKLANAETPRHLVLNELPLNSDNAEVPVNRKQGPVKDFPHPPPTGIPPAAAQTVSDVLESSSVAAAIKLEANVPLSRMNGLEPRVRKTPRKYSSSLENQSSTAKISRPASEVALSSVKRESVIGETHRRRRSHGSAVSNEHLYAEETNSIVSNSDVMDSDVSLLQLKKRRHSFLNSKTIACNDESCVSSEALQASLMRKVGWPKGRPRGKKKHLVEDGSEPIKSSGTDEGKETANSEQESSLDSTSGQCTKEEEGQLRVRNSLPVELNESERGTHDKPKTLPALKEDESSNGLLQLDKVDGHAKIDYAQFEGAESEADVSECTINYLTESEESDSIIEEVCSPQNTINYWNQSINEAHVKYTNDVHTLDENGLRSSNELAVTKTLASVYGSHLSSSVECQMICENAMCVKPAPSSLDNAVDMHHVLQHVVQSSC